MNRPYLERSIGRASRAGVLAATVAAAILANSATWSAALAQQPGSVVQQRDEATIGHQQPRIQNLPPSVVQDEKKMQTELDAAKEIVEKLENRICRGC
jgi:chorismate synthase